MRLCLFPLWRNPILEPGRGIPAEGANGRAEESTRQWYRDAVLHLANVFQRPCTCSRGAQRIHQQGCVSAWAVSGVLSGFTRHAGSGAAVQSVSRNVSVVRVVTDGCSFPLERRWRSSSVVQRRLWTWIHALGNFLYLLVDVSFGSFVCVRCIVNIVPLSRCLLVRWTYWKHWANWCLPPCNAWGKCARSVARYNGRVFYPRCSGIEWVPRQPAANVLHQLIGQKCTLLKWRVGSRSSRWCYWLGVPVFALYWFWFIWLNSRFQRKLIYQTLNWKQVSIWFLRLFSFHILHDVLCCEHGCISFNRFPKGLHVETMETEKVRLCFVQLLVLFLQGSIFVPTLCLLFF